MTSSIEGIIDGPELRVYAKGREVRIISEADLGLTNPGDVFEARQKAEAMLSTTFPERQWYIYFWELTPIRCFVRVANATYTQEDIEQEIITLGN